MKNSVAFKLAGIPMQIIGGNNFAERLKDYFKSAQTAEESTPEIIISVVDSKEAMAFAEQKSKFYAEGNALQINETSFMTKSGRCHYRVDDLFVSGKPVHIWVYYEQRTGVRKAVRDILANFDPYSIGREGEEDRFIGDFLSYSALWWILALALMKYDRVFVHCGAVSKGGKAFVLSGTGGCGKTSIVNELLNDDWKYIAEDFGVVGADGIVWSIPKRGAISAEDVSFGSERLTALIEHLPTWQKVRWNHYTAKNKNPLLSPSLDELYGKDKIAEKANLQKFVCVSRSSTGEILEKATSVEDIAFRTMGAAFRVIREMYNNLHNIHAVVGAELEDSFPSMERIEKRYCDIIKKALRNTEYSVLEVPLKTNPRAMKEYLSL